MNIARSQSSRNFEGARTQRRNPDPNTVMFEKDIERCAQPNSSKFEDARARKASSELNTVVIRAEIHAENTDTEHLVHFEETQDFSDAGSLITAGTTVTVHTRHDQRAFIVGVSDST